MSVYVDDMNWSFKSFILSHMYADTVEELHEMAKRLGLKREWFQNKRKKLPHYDISLSKKRLAIGLGTVPVKYPNHMRKFIKLKKEE